MKTTAFAAGVLLALGISLAGSHHAYAQTASGQDNNKKSQSPVTVTVAEGDTLTAIATAHNTTYPRIFDANDKIQDPNLIYPGDSLRIPDNSEQLPDRPLPADFVAANPLPNNQTPAAAAAPVVKVTQTAPVAGCGDNSYANFIYMHESGCRTTAVNPGGCYGIGQACPGSKLAYCGADYACQNAFFTAYAGKYGGWAGAYAFWVAHGWW